MPDACPGIELWLLLEEDFLGKDFLSGLRGRTVCIGDSGPRRTKSVRLQR